MSNNQIASMEAQRQSAILSHSLKDQLRNLATEYNTKTDLRNQQADVLNKYDMYLTLQNDKINKELQTLKEIESNIATRDALVRANQNEFEKKNKRIHVLKVFFVVVAYLVFVVTAYLGKKISLPFLLTNIILILFAYTLYVAWVYNLLFIKSFTKYVESDLDKMKREIYQEGRHIEDEINQYVNGNCDCPPKKDKNGDIISVLPRKKFSPGTLPYNDGIFYYDGTAPQERLYPLIPDLSTKGENYNPDNYHNKRANPNGFEISWITAPDQGSRDNKRYTPPPTNMSTTVGLPRAGYDKGCQTCEKNYNKTPVGGEESKYWTIDL